jgi:hypothetical protein
MRSAFTKAVPINLSALWHLFRNARSRQEEGRTSFLKKRSKKLLQIWYFAGGSARPNNQKFFGSFFQKRTAFFSLALNSCDS